MGIEPAERWQRRCWVGKELGSLTDHLECGPQRKVVQIKWRKTKGWTHAGLLAWESIFISSKHIRKKAANDFIIEAT